jgi:uncharacterized phage protein (TIGR02220 family)
MAKKRMVSNQIVDSDDFLDMPLSAQCLYFHLLVRADDEGFINGVKKVMRMIGARDDDYKVLVAKSFVMPFESGVCVIKHWLFHNTIRKDRIIETVHIDEKAQIKVKENNAYTFGDVLLTDTCHPSIEEFRLEEISLVKSIVDYLNKKASVNYRSTGKKTNSLIDARISDGFNYNDFVIVIDKKCKDWLNTDMQHYLRPETLFGTKFESYLNQLEVIKPNSKNSNERLTSKDVTDW